VIDPMAANGRRALSVSKTRRYASVFLFVFVLSTLAMGFHHHADGEDRHHCPICAVAHYQAVAGAVFALENPQPLVVLEGPAVLIFSDSRTVATPLPRAPPA
jgi:hypothetical protein